MYLREIDPKEKDSKKQKGWFNTNSYDNAYHNKKRLSLI